MRNAFISELVNIATEGHDVVLIVGDLGYKVVEPFAQGFPSRFFNAGIAEQNMMGLAAGLASEGVHVFVYSIANFPTFRCAEQIRNDIDYHNLPVTICSVGGGVAYGNLGYSHHAVQDYALLRTLPNMLIGAPVDPTQVRSCLRYFIENRGPAYLRLGKAGEVNLCDVRGKAIEPGVAYCLRQNQLAETAIVSTGSIAQKLIKKSVFRGEPFSLFTVPLWGMGVSFLGLEQLWEAKRVIVVEDHYVDGGFGSWILERIYRKPNFIDKTEIIGLNGNTQKSSASEDFLIAELLAEFN